MTNTVKPGGIPKQKQKRPLTPELQALQDKIDRAKAEFKDKRKALIEQNKTIRKSELTSSWVLLRYIQNELRKGNKAVEQIVNEAGASCTPHDGYPPERVEQDKSALREFLKVNRKAT